MVLVAIILPLTLVFALRANSVNLWQLAGLSMTAAGGLGNLLDRIFNQGIVIDFVSFGIGPLRTGIMNLADIAIVVGIVLFMLASAPDKPPSAPQSDLRVRPAQVNLPRFAQSRHPPAGIQHAWPGITAGRAALQHFVRQVDGDLAPHITFQHRLNHLGFQMAVKNQLPRVS